MKFLMRLPCCRARATLQLRKGKAPVGQEQPCCCAAVNMFGKYEQGIRIINLVYFSQIINLLPHADSADLRRTRIVNSRVPSGWQRGRSDSQILRKSAESA